jgi:lambda family phage tail tape measure protein
MADLDYTINVRTDQAERNIDRLKKSVGGLGVTFGDLRKVVGGLALGSLITNTIRWADSIQDVSDSTGIATATILGFGQAVAEAGGTSEGANNALVKFNQTLGEAQQGSKSAQAAFANLGITVDELKSLSSEAIFSKTLAGLRDISSLSRQAAAGADLFGKTLKGVSIDKVTANVDAYATANIQNAKAVQTAADAQESFEKAVTSAQKAFLTSVEPVLRKLSEFLDGINENSKAVQRFFDIAYEAGKWALLAASLTLVGRGVWVIVTAFRAASTAVSAFGLTFRGLLKALKDPLTRGNLLKNLEQLPGIGSKARVIFVALGGSVDFLAKHFGKLAAGTAAAVFGLKEFITGSKEAARIKIQPAPYTQGGPQGGRRVSPEVLAQITQERAEREKAAKEEMMLKAEVLAKQRKEAFAAMNEQLGMDAERAYYDDRQNEKAEYQRNLMEDIALINREIADKTGLEQLATQNELIGLYGREYEIKAELLAIDAERQNAINDAIANLRSISATANAESIAEDVERARREIELAHYVADERLKIFQDRKAKEKAIEQSTLGGIESAFAIIDAESNKFITAQKSVISVFDNMKNAITEFATTGKFKFKDFALSMIRDLLIIQAQQAFNTMFGMAKNPLLAFFGGGKAAGGPVKGNTAYVVGEKGPELFVPKGAGTIVPNNKMNSGSGQAAPANNTYNTYNISAIDSQSVAQFFAQNRKMALGAVTMAQKELSYGS